MTKIERLYNDHTEREFDLPREKHVLIERPDSHFVVKTVAELENTPSIVIKEKNAQDKSEVVNRKTRKIHPKSKQTAMAKVQKEL